MAFTVVTVTGRFLKADGSTPAAGEVTLRLTAALQDPSTNEIIEPVNQTVTLDAAGAIAVPLVATDDPTTEPTGATYAVTERIAGAAVRSYNIVVPHAAVPTLDLADVAPAVPGPELFGYALVGHGHTAAAVAFTPPAGWSATDAQAAIIEAPTHAPGGVTQAQLDAEATARVAADNLRALKAGDTFTGPVLLPAAAPTDDLQAVNRGFVLAQIAAVLGGLPPDALNTIFELAAAVQADEGNITSILASLAGKADKSANLSDLASAATALTNLGFSAFIKTLIDDADAAAARGTLGLGSAATHPTTDFDAAGAAAASQAAAVQRANHTGTQLAATISDFNTAVRTNRLDQMAAPTAAVALNGQKVTGLADGTAATDAVTKQQLDAAGTSFATHVKFGG